VNTVLVVKFYEVTGGEIVLKNGHKTKKPNISARGSTTD